VTGLPFDTQDPPVDPPAQCIDPDVWRRCRALYGQHRPTGDDLCECGHPWPCGSSIAATRLMLVTCGVLTRVPWVPSAAPNGEAGERLAGPGQGQSCAGGTTG
jgi:hypothetical protein